MLVSVVYILGIGRHAHPTTTVETIGYVARAISAKQTPNWALLPYLLQSVLLLLGPTMLAASIYMSLGRLIIFLGADSYCLIPSDMVTKTFIIGDIISFLAQSEDTFRPDVV